MINTELMRDFLIDLAFKIEKNKQSVDKADKLGNLTEYCRKKRLVSNPEVNVISTCTIEIFSEIDEYLEYYHEEIEKGFGASTRDEWNRIYNDVIKLFVENIKTEQNIKDYEQIILLINEFIERWLNFQREDVEKLRTQIKK